MTDTEIGAGELAKLLGVSRRPVVASLSRSSVVAIPWRNPSRAIAVICAAWPAVAAEKNRFTS